MLLDLSTCDLYYDKVKLYPDDSELYDNGREEHCDGCERHCNGGYNHLEGIIAGKEFCLKRISHLHIPVVQAILQENGLAMRQLVLLLFLLTTALFPASGEQETAQQSVQNDPEYSLRMQCTSNKQIVGIFSPKSNSLVGKAVVKNDPVELTFCDGYCIVHNLRTKTYTVDSLYFGPTGKCPGGCFGFNRAFFIKGHGPVYFGKWKLDAKSHDVMEFITLVHFRIRRHADSSPADTIREATRYEGFKAFSHPVLVRGASTTLKECKKGLRLR